MMLDYMRAGKSISSEGLIRETARMFEALLIAADRVVTLIARSKSKFVPGKSWEAECRMRVLGEGETPNFRSRFRREG
jgi:hypothetical protein